MTAAGVDGISLSWTAPAGVEVRGYDVLRCVEGEAPCTPTFLAWVTNGDGDPPPAPTEYTDTNVIPGATFRYVVFASVGNDYTKTPQSNQVTATTEGGNRADTARSGGSGADGPDGDRSRRRRYQPELDRTGR